MAHQLLLIALTEHPPVKPLLAMQFDDHMQHFVQQHQPLSPGGQSKERRIQMQLNDLQVGDEQYFCLSFPVWIVVNLDGETVRL